MRAAALLLCFTCVGAIGCDGMPWNAQPSAADAAATPPDSVLTATCDSLVSSYSPPYSSHDFHGQPNSGNANRNEEAKLFSALSDPNATVAANAAMKLLEKSRIRNQATLDSAILVEARLGDYRVLPELEQMAVNAFALNALPATYDFGARPRSAAAAAIGRIIEQNRSTPPGCADLTGPGCDPAGWNSSTDGSDTPIDAIAPADVSAAVTALSIGACIGQPLQLRSTATEAIGLTQSHAAVSFLNEVDANPGTNDLVQDATVQLIAARSLTNITHNNHVLTQHLIAKDQAILDQVTSNHVVGSP